jgi:hypothetical protein
MDLFHHTKNISLALRLVLPDDFSQHAPRDGAAPAAQKHPEDRDVVPDRGERDRR